MRNIYRIGERGITEITAELSDFHIHLLCHGSKKAASSNENKTLKYPCHLNPNHSIMIFQFGNAVQFANDND